MSCYFSKCKEHIACYKHIVTKYVQKHCYKNIDCNTLLQKTLLQSQNIDITLQKKSHSSNNTADKGLMNKNNNGSIQAISRQDGKGEF